ncbi:eukaryotic translation initiation factor 2 subunit 2-like [Tropilaelaps mercedesae]|uniref:Eukaryotic translation initiation factor 2 subunit 2 n=1 Tax=Tropilaelaps mercedesae TaxID=418985 RepID=A0A1V9Y2T3_9ACAR|nr:eukaryotic translation initiation factor 2 subunit 2-like [Tropilaelaps mercedesae]
MSKEGFKFDLMIKNPQRKDIKGIKDATPGDDAFAKAIIGELAFEENNSSRSTDTRKIIEDAGADMGQLKKKKKKSSFKFNDFGGDAMTRGEEDNIEHIRAYPAAGEVAPMLNVDDSDDLDFAKLKKKKKKKTAFKLEPLEDTLEVCNRSTAEVVTDEIAPMTEQVVDEDDVDDLDFNNMKKKKKKKKVIFGDDVVLSEDRTDSELDGTTASIEAAGNLNDDNSGPDGGNEAWRGSDRDYSYEELLQRIFNIMREKNPDMVAGDKRKLVMKPPQVIRVGTKKTSFANFLEITRTLRRAPKHLQAFLMAEMGTSGSIDANNQLIIKGRFQQKQIEHILRRYIKEYVTCHTCRAPETILEKDTRINFIRCEKCGSRCSVQSIKSGFQAVTTKRAAMRARAT